MALGDLHIFTGEEYVDTELAPLLNENFNSLKEYVDDASRWQVMPVQFKGTNAKFLIHETTLGTGTTQVLPLVVLDNTDIAKFSACSLKVVMSTKNGSTAAVNCDINLQKVHNSNECNVNFNTTNSDDAKAEPCTFTYNNIKYAGLKLTTGNADTLWVSGYTTEDWIAPVVNTSVTNLVTLGSDMNVIPTLFKSLQTDKSPVNDYDVVNKKSLNDLTNIKTYSQLSQIGLSGGVLDNSPYAIGNALPANSMLITPITGTANTYNYPKTSGQLVVIRSNSNRVYYEVQDSSGNTDIENFVGLFIIDQVSTDTDLIWKRILTDVDTGYWQPNETVTKDTVRKLIGKQYAGCFLVCKVAGTTGSTQPSPDPADGAGIGGGSGSITFYSSLEEIGITPGQETFASIHFALPINSVLSYYVTPNNFNNSIYPSESYGYVCCSKTSDTSSTNFIFSTQNVSKLDVYTRYFNQTFPQEEREWTLLAKQSDLTNLSNSLGEAAYRDLANNSDFLSKVPLVSGDGVMEIGQYIDFHIADSSNADFDIRLQATTNGLSVQTPSTSITFGGWTISKGTNGWARESSTGFTIQWMRAESSGSVTFPRTFTTVYGAVATSKNRGNTTLGVGAAMVTALSTTKATVCQAVMSDEQYNRVNTQNLNGYVLAYGIS